MFHCSHVLAFTNQTHNIFIYVYAYRYSRLFGILSFLPRGPNYTDSTVCIYIIVIVGGVGTIFVSLVKLHKNTSMSATWLGVYVYMYNICYGSHMKLTGYNQVYW